MERFAALRRLFVFLLLLPWPLAAQAQPQQRPVPNLSLPSTRLDAESLLQRQREFAPNAVRLSLPALAGRRIADGDGVEETLDRVATRLFADNAAFESQARRAGAGVLVARPQSATEAFDQPDSYVLLRSTRVLVADPAAFARVSPAFASFMAERPSTPASYAALSPEHKARIDAFIATEAQSLPAGDPLAAAARQGPEAVVRAIAEGKGEFEIVDTFVVPKQPLPRLDGRLQLPRFENGVFRLDRLRTIDSRVLAALAAVQPPTLRPPPPERPSLGVEGRHSFEQPFLTGFTLGNSWQWERRWNYFSGFFRVSLGAGYGIGLRVPVKVSGTVSPGGVTRRAPVDLPDRVTVRLAGETIDGDSDYFRRTGLESGLVMGGNEFVLNAGFYYGLKFRVFWSDIVHIRRTEVGFDLNSDWRAPFGGDRGSGRIVVPATLTRTQLDLGVLRGKAEAAFNIGGRGQVGLDYEFTVDDRVVRRQRLNLRDRNAVAIAEEVPALAAGRLGQESSRRYGMRIANPVYQADLDVTPEVQIAVRVGVDGFSRRFSTGWLPLNRFRISLGSIRLERHAGTAGEYRFDEGFKRFTRIAGDAQSAASTATTPEPPELTRFIALRARSNGKYVRAGITDRTLLAAFSTAIGGWERFEVSRLGADRIALRSQQNGKYVRGGAGQDQSVAAVSSRVRSWETFVLERRANGNVALRSVENNRYVSVAPDGRLTSNAARAGENEMFELVLLK
ncbi:MAG: hypothetical protein AB7F36_15740 [Reyranellaceae bacterium]